jgi:cellulose synthase/poly-beta-1,6-N-acetylglucosamine synthase-like glycosyltransferase
MEWLLVIAFAAVICFLLIQLFCIVSVGFIYKTVLPYTGKEPFVSVLLAVRNEEAAILRCFQSLEKIDYPSDKIEILVGNDHSEDRSREIITAFISGKPGFRLIDIGENLGKAKGKANVLAHLARASKGEFLFITDADIRVQPGWVKGLLGAFKKDTGTVSGTTITEGNSLFALLQTLEWTYFMGMIKAFGDYRIPATGVGNNMAVRREAYDSIGGYEGMDFSITEDHKLFKEVIKKGWGWDHLMQPENLNVSLPVEDFRILVQQRRRWIAGGKELALYWWLVFVLFALFYPALIVIMLAYGLKTGLLLWAARILLQHVFLVQLFRKLGQTFKPVYGLMFEGYSIFNALITPFMHLMPGSIIWKGRPY